MLAVSSGVRVTLRNCENCAPSFIQEFVGICSQNKALFHFDFANVVPSK